MPSEGDTHDGGRDGRPSSLHPAADADAHAPTAADPAAGAADAAAAAARVRVQLAHDRLVALIVPSVYLPYLWRIAPQLPLTANLQWASLVGCVPLAYLLWPALSRPAYERWRTHLVAAMRIWAFTMPLTHDPHWFNVTAPADARAPLLAICMGACLRAWVLACMPCNVCSGRRPMRAAPLAQALCRFRPRLECNHAGSSRPPRPRPPHAAGADLVMLCFMCVAFAAPFRLHLLLQSLSVAQLAARARRPFCAATHLLTSPLWRGRIASLHVDGPGGGASHDCGRHSGAKK